MSPSPSLPFSLALSLLLVLPFAGAEPSTYTVDDGGPTLTPQLSWYPPSSTLAWSNKSNDADFVQGTAHTSYLQGSGVTLQFNGTGISYVTTMNADHSVYSVVLDGQVTPLNGTAASWAPNVTQFSKTGLDQSVPHTISIVLTEDNNHPIDIDAFLVTVDTSLPSPPSTYGTLPAPPAGGCVTNTSFDDTHPSVTYWPSASWRATTGNDSFANGTVTTAMADGAGATVSFNGSAVYYVGSRNFDHGSFVTVLDGVIGPVAGNFWTGLQTKQVLWSAEGLDETRTHSLTVLMIGSGEPGMQRALDVDEFIVTSTQPTCSSKTSAAARRAPRWRTWPALVGVAAAWAWQGLL